MRETALVLPTFNSEKQVEAALHHALLQTVSPYKIVVADEGSTDDTVSLASRIGRHATSAGLSWFRFEVVLPSKGRTALDTAFDNLRSDCVVLCDLTTRLETSWCGAASVALYSVQPGYCLYTDGAAAFHSHQWRKLRPRGGFSTVKAIIDNAARSKRLILGDVIGSYVLQ